MTPARDPKQCFFIQSRKRRHHGGAILLLWGSLWGDLWGRPGAARKGGAPHLARKMKMHTKDREEIRHFLAASHFLEIRGSGGRGPMGIAHGSN